MGRDTVNRRIERNIALFAIALILVLQVHAILPNTAHAAMPYDAINANIPLRKAILAYYAIEDRDFDTELCSDIKARNITLRDYTMLLRPDAGITSLNGIDILDSLGVTELYISGLKAPFAAGGDGLHALASLTALQTLEAEGCGMGALPAMQSIKRLSLRGNAISSIASAASCPALQELDISANPVTDLSPLAGKNSLQKLSIGGGKIGNWAFLAGMGGLTDLSIKDAGFKDADWQHISGLAKLQNLTLADNYITSADALKRMKEAGRLPALKVASLENNFIGEWADNLPASLGGIRLTAASSSQYKPAILLSGVHVDSITLSKDTTFTVAKRLAGGNAIAMQPVEVKSSSPNMVAAQSGGSVILSPRMAGDAVLSLRLFGGAANEANVSLNVPVSIQGGTLSATLHMVAGGRTVYYSRDGLFEGSQVQIGVPPREECRRLFQAVGIDLDDYEMPDPAVATVQAGQAASITFPRITTGSVTIRHVMDNGDEMAREQLNMLQAGSYTYHPRADIPAYVPVSPAQTVRINHNNRSPVITFRYKFDRQRAAEAKKYAASVGSTQVSGANTAHTPAQPFTLKGESRAAEAGAMFAAKGKAACCPTDYVYMGIVQLKPFERFAAGTKGRVLLSNTYTARLDGGGIKALRRGSVVMFIVKECGHVQRYDIEVAGVIF